MTPLTRAERLAHIATRAAEHNARLYERRALEELDDTAEAVALLEVTVEGILDDADEEAVEDETDGVTAIDDELAEFDRAVSE